MCVCVCVCVCVWGGGGGGGYGWVCAFTPFSTREGRGTFMYVCKKWWSKMTLTRMGFTSWLLYIWPITIPLFLPFRTWTTPRWWPQYNQDFEGLTYMYLSHLILNLTLLRDNTFILICGPVFISWPNIVAVNFKCPDAADKKQVTKKLPGVYFYLL